MERVLVSALTRTFAVALALAALATPLEAAPWWLRGAGGEGRDFLPPDAAFRVSARIAGSELDVHWTIANGYYLYRSKMQVAAASPDLIVEPLRLPPGQPLEDRYFGPQQVYRHEATASARFTRLDYGAHPLQIRLTYQGCAEAGLCYPPIVKVLFPDQTAAAGPAPAPPSPRWEWLAIAAGLLGFLLAGLFARRNRVLPTPSA